MSALKPCPFCGSDRISTHHIRDGRSCSCASCGASVHTFQPDADRTAKEAWNRRADIGSQSPAPSELLAMLQQFVDEFGGSIEQYHKLGPDWTQKDGNETFNVSVLLDREELIEEARGLISRAEGRQP